MFKAVMGVIMALYSFIFHYSEYYIKTLWIWLIDIEMCGLGYQLNKL